MALSLKDGRSICRFCASLVPQTKTSCNKCGRSLDPNQYSTQAHPGRERINEEGVRKQQGKILLKEMVKRAAISVVIIIVLTAIFLALSDSRDLSETGKANLPDPERLNVSEPTFSIVGIHFTLYDTRPNTALWVSVKVGRTSPDKNLMGWISLYSVKSGTVSVPFQDCKYLDAGLDSLASATKCEVTIGARLQDANKIVYTAYDAPISELRRSLIDSAK